MAVAFGLMILPVMFVAGAALDYSGASDLQVRLQRATDATALQLCQMGRAATLTQRQAKAEAAIASYMGGRSFTVPTLTVTASPYQVYIATRASFQTAIVLLMGPSFATIDVAADARCQAEQQTFEIALVLDNTGSMAASSGTQTKIEALRAAATSFVNFVFTTPTLSQSKVSIVPFSSAVAVSPVTYRNASWIDQSGRASYHWAGVLGGAAAAQGAGATSRFDAFTQLKSSIPAWDWNGCFESLPYPLNTQDGAPSSSNLDSYYVPMFAPDESGDGGQFSHPDATGSTVYSANSYINDTNALSSCPLTTDEAQRTGRACKYMSIVNPQTSNGYTATGPNASCTSRPLTRLTNNKTLLLNEISQLVAAGQTNIHEGAMWGWRTISPNSVFGDGVAYDKPLNNKIIVIMTDGTNTWSPNASNPTTKSSYSAYGFYRNPDGTSPNSRLPPANADPTSATQARTAIDALTLAACRNMTASPSNVQVYTVGFSVPADPIDAQGIQLLQTCAGSPDRAFVANDSAALVEAFQKIAESIAALRLNR